MVTTTSTVPAALAPVVQVIEVDDRTLGEVHVTPPKLAIAPVRNPVPVRVTAVAPATTPVVGDTLVTVGAA